MLEAATTGADHPVGVAVVVAVDRQPGLAVDRQAGVAVDRQAGVAVTRQLGQAANLTAPPHPLAPLTRGRSSTVLATRMCCADTRLTSSWSTSSVRVPASTACITVAKSNGVYALLQDSSLTGGRRSADA